ncbi:MAG: hypothetical protein Q8K32_04745 [Archangium sp.]|nr:hypothetical protein [Archangium sp.]
MPTPDEILAGLISITNRGFIFAVAWHLLVGAGLIAASQQWRASARLEGALLIAPLLSVSAFAWGIEDRFTGTVFLALSAALGLISWRSNRADVPRQKWTSVLGVVLISFAWVYPEFLRGWPQVTSLIASPMGLTPCPTLALVMGFTLLGYGPASRGWAVVLALAASFYAGFGVMRLGVKLDLVLLVGAMGLAVRALGRPRGAERRLQLVH